MTEVFKVTFSWFEGREERKSEVRIPMTLTYPQMEEYFRNGVRKAVKYSDAKVPEGLLKEGESL